jgi:hypothetical protein
MTTEPMTKQPFQPFNLDLDDQLERIAQAKGVPALTTPPIIADHDRTLHHTAEEGAQQTFTHATQQPPATADLPVKPPPCEARVKVPDYLMMELKMETVRRRVSLNHLFLAGLRATGFTVHDEDMIEDGRRLRGKNSPQHSSRNT